MVVGGRAVVVALPFRGQVGTVVRIDGPVTWLRFDNDLEIGFLQQSIKEEVLS